MKKANTPTEREYSILKVLWREPSTVRQVHTALSQDEAIAYTSVLTTLQIMFKKGLVSRDESERSHVYKALNSKEETQKGVVGEMLSRVFEGSAMNLVTRALELKAVSQKDINALRDYLDNWED